MLFSNEATIVDDTGVLVFIQHVDLRPPGDRTPVTTLFKAGRRIHAIGELGTIRISKPVHFRESGEGLILDPNETFVSRTEVNPERIDDPEDLAETRRIDDEWARSGTAIGARIKMATSSIRKTGRSTHTLAQGKNGWIYSTAIEPVDGDDVRRWKESLPPHYDHAFRIHRPRAFARALGLMVAEQLGPRGQVASLKHAQQGGEPFRTRHQSQAIFHGPVIYAADPFEWASALDSPMERLLGPLFVKHPQFAGWCEYRFVIWAEDEPTERYVDLVASKAMFDSVEAQTRVFNDCSEPPVAEAVDEPESLASDECPADGMDRAVKADVGWPSSPTTPQQVHTGATRIGTAPPTDTDRPTGTNRGAGSAEAILSALRHEVEQMSGERRTQAASAAWHAEPWIRSLCSKFVDPVESVCIADDDTLVVALRIPADGHASAAIAFGPLGSYTYRVTEGEKESVSFGKPSPLTFELSNTKFSVSLGVPDSLLVKLAHLGLKKRE